MSLLCNTLLFLKPLARPMLSICALCVDVLGILYWVLLHVGWSVVASLAGSYAPRPVAVIAVPIAILLWVWMTIAQFAPVAWVLFDRDESGFGVSQATWRSVAISAGLARELLVVQAIEEGLVVLMPPFRVVAAILRRRIGPAAVLDQARLASCLLLGRRIWAGPQLIGGRGGYFRRVITLEFLTNIKPAENVVRHRSPSHRHVLAARHQHSASTLRRDPRLSVDHVPISDPPTPPDPVTTPTDHQRQGEHVMPGPAARNPNLGPGTR